MPMLARIVSNRSKATPVAGAHRRCGGEGRGAVGTVGEGGQTFPEGTDDGASILHEARWLQYSRARPGAYWKQVSPGEAAQKRVKVSLWRTGPDDGGQPGQAAVPGSLGTARLDIGRPPGFGAGPEEQDLSTGSDSGNR